MKSKKLKTKKSVSVKKKLAQETKGIISIPVYTSKGEKSGRQKLDERIFSLDVNSKVLYQTIRMYNANSRSGNASTKTRSDVSGGGKKPFRQKGTGRARAGSTRSPLWRGGGKVFGPHPRNFHYELPKKVLRAGIVAGLNSKISEEAMIGIESLDIPEPKTKCIKAVIDALKLKGKVLFVLEVIDEKIGRAARNMPHVRVKRFNDINAYDVLACDNIVFSRTAIEKLHERFGIKNA